MNDGRPGRFVWRGRLYAVLAIVERPQPQPREGAEVGEPGEPGEPDQGGEPDQRLAWRCWRVTASPGKNVPAVGFRLCHNPVSDRWLLSRDSA